MADAEYTIKAALEALGVPVRRLRYTGKEDTFITYQLVTGRDTAFGDDESEAEESLYRVDVFSKSNYIALLRRVKRALKDAGLYGIIIDPEVYESDTGFYHVPLEAKYLEV